MNILVAEERDIKTESTNLSAAERHATDCHASAMHLASTHTALQYGGKGLNKDPPPPSLPPLSQFCQRTFTCPVISSGPSSVCRNIVLCHLTGTISGTSRRGGGKIIRTKACSARNTSVYFHRIINRHGRASPGIHSSGR